MAAGNNGNQRTGGLEEAELARNGRWARLYFEIAKATIVEYRRTFYQFLVPLLRRDQPDPSEFLVSLEASLSHDGTDALGRILAPTLVIGGTKDRFFPEALMRETARRIPGATLSLIPGAGHGACEERRKIFARSVLEFMSAATPACRATPASSAVGSAGAA